MKYFIYVMCVLMTLSIPVEITSRKAVNISGEIDVNLCKEPVEFEGKIIYPSFISIFSRYDGGRLSEEKRKV